MKLSKGLLLLLFCLSALSFSVEAAQVEIHPGITLGREYTNNLFLTESNPQSDWITTVEPGILLNYKTPSVDIALDYSLNFKLYQKHNEENLDKFADVQRSHSSGLFFDGRPFTLRLNGDISRESLDVRNNSAPLNDLTNKSTVYHLTAAPEYRWQLSPSFSVIFGYLYDRIEVVDAADDSEGHTGSLSLEKQLSTNTLVTSTYRYLEQSSDVGDNYNQQDYTLGLTQQFGPRLSVKAEGGASQVAYRTGRDLTRPNWLVGLSYQLSTPINLKLDYAQKFQLSASDGLSENRIASGHLGYISKRVETAVELYWNEAIYAQLVRQDQAWGARFNLHRLLTKVFFFDLNADAERANFKPEDEQVDRYGLGGAFGITYRRVVVSLSSHYRINNSDLAERDYRNLIFALNATLRF